MRVFGVLLAAGLVLSTNAFGLLKLANKLGNLGSKDDYFWQADFRILANSDYIIGYDESTEGFSFYNPYLGVDVTFDGSHGIFGLVNTTSGNVLIHYRDGTAKFVHPNNKNAIIDSFRRGNLKQGFKEAGKAVSDNHFSMPFISRKFNVFDNLARMITYPNNDDDSNQSKLLREIRADTAGLQGPFMNMLDHTVFFSHNGALMVLGAVMSGPHVNIPLNFMMLMSAIIDSFQGRFNKKLMLKVLELIQQGLREKFVRANFNPLIASISLVSALTLGIGNKVDHALYFINN